MELEDREGLRRRVELRTPIGLGAWPHPFRERVGDPDHPADEGARRDSAGGCPYLCRGPDHAEGRWSQEFDASGGFEDRDLARYGDLKSSRCHTRT